jgi:ABC-2 type transport system permease protein
MTAPAGAVKVARDTWLIFSRQLQLTLRTPVGFVIGLIQPVIYVVLWAPVLRLALQSTGVTSYAEAFRAYVPGLVTVMAVYGGLFSGFGLLVDIRSGVIERSRVTPVSRVALMLGRALRDVASMFAGAVLITVFAVVVGMRIGPGNLVLAWLLVILLDLAMVSLGYALSMSVRNEAALLTVIDTAVQPVMLLAGVLIPLTVAPLLLVRIAKWDPFYWVTTGVRALFNGSPGALAVWVSLVVVLALAGTAMAWSVRMFARLA